MHRAATTCAEDRTSLDLILDRSRDGPILEESVLDAKVPEVTTTLDEVLLENIELDLATSLMEFPFSTI